MTLEIKSNNKTIFKIRHKLEKLDSELHQDLYFSFTEFQHNSFFYRLKNEA